MRIIVNCSGGATHSMMLLQSTTLRDVKELVADREGTPVSQQALLFAGRQLQPDSALLLDELRLDAFSLAHDVVVYMQPQLSQPTRVYLCGQPGSANNRMHPEMVEAGSTLANIQGLLLQRQLACMPFPPPDQPHTSTGGSSSSGGTSGSSNVVVKRQADGCCCIKVAVREHTTIQGLLEAIWEAEGKSVSTLSFYQAPDGCLHALYGAAAASTSRGSC